MVDLPEPELGPPLKARVASAEHLLRERNAAQGRGWLASEWITRKGRFFDRTESEEEQVVSGLLLVGREWLRGLSLEESGRLEELVYGPDRFNPLAFDEPCESLRLWGYKCPFETREFAADHLFPAALGGPTDAANRLTLCRWHNTAKSMDIHMFPWEEGVPSWVAPVITKMGAWIENA